MELRVGQNIQGYELLGEVGKGGQAHVWSAKDELGAFWALKTTKPGNNSARLLREHDLLREIRERHGGFPCVPQGKEFLLVRDRPFLVFELIQGISLAQALKLRAGELSLQHRICLLRQLAATLAFLHERAIVHRDVQDSNVMLTHEFWSAPDKPGTIKLIDFGIAVQPGNLRPLTYEGRGTDAEGAPAAPGSYPYMAPEALLSPLSPAERADPRIDTFAFGVLGWQLLAGQHPIGVLSSLEDLREAYREATASRRPWPSGSPGVPFTPLLTGCLQLERSQRTRDGTVLLSLLEASLSVEGTSTHEAPVLAPGPVRGTSASGSSPGASSSPPTHPADYPPIPPLSPPNAFSSWTPSPPAGTPPTTPMPSPVLPFQPSPTPPTVDQPWTGPATASTSPAATLPSVLAPVAPPPKRHRRWLLPLALALLAGGLALAFFQEQLSPSSPQPSPTPSDRREESPVVPPSVELVPLPSATPSTAIPSLPRKRCPEGCTGTNVCIRGRCGPPPKFSDKCEISPRGDDGAEGVVLREKATPRASALRKYNAGARIHLVTPNQPGWVQVEMKDGKEGFLRNDQIECN